MYWVALVLQILLALAFLMSGFSKLTSQKQMVDNFQNHYHYPLWFMFVTGAIEALAAIALVVGIWVPVLATIGAVLLACTMVGAVLTHARTKDGVATLAPSAVLFILSIVLLAIHRPLL